MKKGSQICISGRLQTGKYEDKDGKVVYTTDVIVEEVDFADSKKDESANKENHESLASLVGGVPDDLPF